MTQRSLADWLSWQESLNPHAIDLGLDRVHEVAARLSFEPPTDAVFTVAGTNGKGSTASFLEYLMAANGRSTGVYMSPHLVRYNERVRVDGIPVSDRRLVAAFETVEAVRGDVPLTYFEYGTLAAMVIFGETECRAWILEVGLGGRLDAVNVIDPDYSLITTVALDHQEWLGRTMDAIAAEKAGILRPAKPAFYGDEPCPEAILSRARDLGAGLHCYGRDYDYETGEDTWTWRGESVELVGLPQPDVADGAQLRNLSLALAAIEIFDPALLQQPAVDRALLAERPAGRFQVVEREHQWILDVAHNPQAARVLCDRLRHPEPRATTAVFGLLATKQADAVLQEIASVVDRWIVCSMPGCRAVSAQDLAATLAGIGSSVIDISETPEQGFDLAASVTGRGDRILVCGSFHMVGPALRWLGLY